MSREARVWLAICLVSGGFLLYRGASLVMVGRAATGFT
jgi:hypothetical protein